MSDIGIFTVDNCFQLVIEDGDLKGDDGLETAAIISLFTDQRVSDDELPDGHTSKRGYWGDMFPPVEGDEIGSKLWLLGRGKADLETLAGIENYAAESLKWMIDDGVAAAIDVSAEYDESKSAIVAISITRPKGEQDKFSVNWNAQELLRA